MSETEISQTPEGRPPEAAGSGSPPDAAPPLPNAPAAVVPLVRPGATAPKEQGAVVAGPEGRAGESADEQEKPARGRRRSGRERRSKQVGRYLVCVHVQPHMTQIAMLE